MKQIYSRFLAVITLLLIAPTHSYSQYCTTNLYGTSGCNFFGAGDYIQSFSTSGGSTNISNLNTGCSNTTTAYTYFSTQNHTGIPGGTVNFTIVNNPNYGEIYKIWVDWNQDNDFIDLGEEVYASATIATNGSVTSSFAIPPNATAGIKRLRVRCTDPTIPPTGGLQSCNLASYGECEDYNLTVQPNVACSGTPTVSMTGTSTLVCAATGLTSTLTATPGTVATGYTYQWQSAPECSNSYTNIANATNSTYTVTQPSIPAIGFTSFRVVLTCSGSGLSANSTAISIYPGCYCTSGANVGSGADIGQVSVSTTGYSTVAYPAVPPATYVNVGSASSTYSNFTGLSSIPNLAPGVTSNYSIIQVNSGATQSPAYAKLYVDFNRDGDFNDAGEESDPGAGTTSTAGQPITGSITTPASAVPGYTRMRVVLIQGGSAAAVSSCNSTSVGYTVGETEDYRALIQPITTPVTAGNNGPLCSNGTIQLSATNASCASYSWTGPNSFSSTLQNPTILNATAANAGVYTVVATSPYGLNSTSNTTVTINPASTNSISVDLCQGSSINFGPQTITTGGTYTQNFPTSAGCDSIVTLNVTPVPKPAPPTITTPVIYCQGATATQLTANGSGILWYTSATTGIGSATAPTPSATTPGSITHYVSQTVNGCESNRDSITVTVNPTPAINFSSSSNPTTCGGNNGSITITGLTSNTAYSITYTLGSTASGPFTFSSNASGVLVITGLVQGSYNNIRASLNNCPSNALGPVALTDPPTPAIPIASSNSPICQGSTLMFNATSTTSGVSFSWTGPGSFSSNVAAPTIPNAQPANSGGYSVTATLNGCTSAAGTTTATINPLPVISSTSLSNPTTCGGTNGSITLNGLTANTTYTIHYNSTNVGLTTNGTGSVTISNLSAGSYSNITATLNGCTSTSVGPLTLSDPPIPAAPVASNNGPLCSGGTLNLTASAITGATYSWNGPASYISSVQNPSVAAVTAANAGVYSVTATVAGCTSPAGATTVVINTTPVITSATGTNPTTCGGVNGSITLTGLLANTTYTISFSQNLNPATTVSATSNGTGVVTVTGLGASAYSSITATLNGCTSSFTGPVTLSNPSTPAAPTVGNNGPLCSGATLNLTASSLAGGTYSWTGPGSYSSSLQNPNITNAQVANAGVYTVTVTQNNCTSPASSTTVVINQTPAISSTSSSNATACGANNGTITLNGLNPGSTYTVNYTFGATPVSSSQTANASGGILLTNLAPGTYSGITASANGCASNPVGPFIISNPPTPASPTAGNNGPLCAGNTLNLTASTIAGATYSWSGPGSYSSQNPTVAGVTTAQAGIYSVTATVSGCTSAAGTTNVVVNLVPTIAGTTSVNPSACGASNGAITLTGLSNSTSYTVSYSFNSGAPVSSTISSNASGSLTIPSLAAGSYGNITVTLNGCTSSPAGPVVLTNPSAPAPPTPSNNGPLCSSTTLNLSTTAVTGATYTWTGPNSFSSNVQNPSIPNVTTATAGVYTLTITVSNCTSAPGTTTVVVNPTPVVSSTSVTHPTTCGGTNGSITLNGLTASTIYSVAYTLNSTPATATLTSNAGGILVIPNLGSGTYSNIIVTLGPCSSTAAGPFTLNNPPTPATPIAGSNTPLCAGATLNLTTGAVAGATYSWTGPNSFTSAAQNPSISSAQPVNSGVYSVTVTVNNCTSLAGNATVVVHPIPSISSITGNNPTACNGTNGSINIAGLNNSTSYSINYTLNSNPLTTITATSNGTGVATINNLGTGTYSNITVTLNGCTSSASGPVTLVNPATPATPVASSNSPVCQGTTLSLSTPTIAGATYTWTGPGPFNSSAQNPNINNAPLTAAGTYSVTVTVNNCTSLAGTTTVVVNPTPATPTTTTNSPVCDGSTLLLGASYIAGAAYSWTGPNSFTSATQSPVIVAATTAATGVYSVVAIVNNCPSLPATVSATVHPIPPAPAVTNISYCQYLPTTALTATGQNLLWYTTPTGGPGSATAPVPSSANFGTTTWYVSQTINGCESPRAAITVTVIQAPALPGVVSPVEYCQFETASPLTATGVGLRWYTVPVGGTQLSAAPLPSTVVPGTFTWYVSQYDGGCEGNRATINVVVHPKPDTPHVPNPLLFCRNDQSAAINLPGVTWYTSATGGTGSTTTPAVDVTTAGTTIYYVTQTQNNCESDRSMVVVTVNENVEAEIVLDNNIICQYDTITVSNTGTNPSTAVYNWNFNGGTVVSGSNAGPYTISWNTPGNKTVSLTISNFNCVDTDTEDLLVKPSPSAEFQIKPDACVNEEMYVQASWTSLNVAAYDWDFADALMLNSASGAGAYRLKFETSGPRVLSLQTTENGCSSQPYRDTINIHDGPVVKIAPLNGERICQGTEVIFKIDGTPNPDYVYLWMPFDRFIGNAAPEVLGVAKSTGYIWLETRDRFGCKNTDSMMVTTEPCCTVALPGAFTPNNDGKNDLFRIITDGRQQISMFRVVNRWGQTIFETADSRTGWDGTFNGKPQDMGTYYYYLRYQCGSDETFEKRGEVTLVR